MALVWCTACCARCTWGCDYYYWHKLRKVMRMALRQIVWSQIAPARYGRR